MNKKQSLRKTDHPLSSSPSRPAGEFERAVEALHVSEEKYRAIIENIEDGYYEIDLNGQFSIFNESFRKITGYTTEQLKQLDYRRLLTPVETEKVLVACS